MRAASRRRLETIESTEPADEDWKTAASRRVLLLALHDPNYADLARKSHICGTPPEDVERYEAEATAYFVDLCLKHGEHRYADLILAESSHDTN